MRVIFLDIDGCLVTSRSCVGQSGVMQSFDPVAVNMVRVLAEDSNARLVLSSTWRLRHDQLTMTGFLINAGFRNVRWHQAWATPSSVFSDPSILDSSRGVAIDAWLQEHGAEVSRYLILDDDSDLLDYQKDFWVRPHHADGISFEEYLRCREILGI